MTMDCDVDCMCAGKEAFAERAIAQQVLERRRRRGRERDFRRPLRVYRCDLCRAWHIGSFGKG
jgi:hypothetical protein